MLAAAAAGPSAYWYLTRGTGIVALVLLTISVALGVANVRRVRTERMPRFVLDAVHRNVSMLAMAFLVLHILTSVLDKFAPISLINAVIPFTGTYRPLWLGLGAVAFDLLVAVLITSLLRRRFGHRAWRVTHWAVYAAWPVALLHGLGTGSDVKTRWMLVIIGACVIVMLVAVVSRATAGWPEHAGARLSALLGAALIPLALLVWLPSGPLAAGWAQKAGTPAALLAASKTTERRSGGGGTTVTAFTANASGTVAQSQLSDGLAGVDISLALAGQKLNALAIHLEGQPLDGGGLSMTSSSVTLGPPSSPSQYTGQVTSLNGTDITARVSGAGGQGLTLSVRLQINADAGTASGMVSAAP